MSMGDSEYLFVFCKHFHFLERNESVCFLNIQRWMEWITAKQTDFKIYRYKV